MAKKFTIFVEDYNVPFTPWSILIERVLSHDLSGMTENRFSHIDNMLYYQKDFVIWAADEKKFAAVGDYFNKRIVEDKKYASLVYDKHIFYFDKSEKFIDQISKTDLRKKTNKELLKLYEKYYDIFSETWHWGLVIQFLDMGSDKYSDRVKNSLYEKLSKIGDPEVVFSKLITPIQDTAISLEQVAILKTVKSIQENKDSLNIFKKAKSAGDLPKSLQRKLSNLVKKFGWLQYYYIGPAASEDYYFGEVVRLLSKNVDSILLKKSKEKKSILDFQDKHKKSFSSEEIFALELLSKFLYLKEARKEIAFNINYTMHSWYAEVGRRFHWSFLQTRYILKDELEQLLIKNNSVVAESDLNSRYINSILALHNNKKFLYTGKKATEFSDKYLQKQVIAKKNIKELKGTVAFEGKAKAIVKIVNSISDLKNFNDGDILVSISTNPSLVPAMNRAAAIVTDTGGVTCHAAIVSRELGIPCIIGTKIASKVFKNGDRVEVDAVKGIIRKI